MANFQDLVALTHATEAGRQAGMSNDQAFSQAVQAKNQGNIAQYTQQISGNTPARTIPNSRLLNQENLSVTAPLSSIDNLKAYRANQPSTAVDKAGEIINSRPEWKAEMAKRTQPFVGDFADRAEYDAAQANPLRTQLKRLEAEKATRSQIWENGIYMGEDEKTAAEYDTRIADVQNQLKAIEAGEREARLREKNDKASEYASMRNNMDFALYAGMGQNMGYKDHGGYSVSGNKVNFANEYQDIIEKEYAAPHIVHRYSGTNNLWNLTFDEKQTYYYILAKEGEKKADEFLDWMQETLNYRAAEGIASDIEEDSGISRVMREVSAGLISGNTSSLSGLGQNLQSDARATTTDEFLQQMIQQNIAKRTGTEDGGYSLEGIASSAANSIGNMIPSMAVGMLNPAAGSVLQGLSSKGNTYKQLLDEGYSKAQAEAVSIPTGIAEAALQYALGGVSTLGGKVTNHAVEKATANISNGLSRSLVRLGISNLDEVTEELLQNKIGTLLRNGILGENESLSWNAEDWDTVLMTLITTTLLNAPSTIGSSIAGGQNVHGLNQATTPQQAQQMAQNVQGDIQTPPTVQNANMVDSQRFNAQGSVNTSLRAESPYTSGKYSLAYGMESAEDIRRETSKFKNVVAGIDTSVKDFFHKWSNGRKSHLGDKLEKLYLGEITDEARAALSNLLGYEVTSTDYILSNDGVKHILDEHGNPSKEIKNGNLPITDAVLESLPNVIANPDSISLGHKEARGDRVGIVFKKNLPDGTVVYVQFDNTGRGNIEGKTLYVKPATTPGVNADTSANTFTSETTGPVAQTEANPTSLAAIGNTGASSLNLSIPNSTKNVNAQNGGNLRERGNSRNIRTDEAMESGLRQYFENEPLMYEQLSNKDTLAKAQDIFSSGFDVARDKLRESIGNAKRGYKLPPEMIPLAKMVENELYQQGNYEEAIRIASDISVELTAAGQLGQANIILRNASPVTVLETVQKAIDRINEEPAVKRGKWEAKLTQDEIDLINSTDFSQDGSFEEVYGQIASRLGEEMPASLWEKLKEIRRVNMLLRPRTQIKNVMGNVPTLVMRKAANELSGAIQDVLVKTGKIDEADQTRTFITTKESREIAKQAYEQYKATLQQESNKWDMNSLLRENRTYFKSKLGKATYENARQLTYKLLEAGDAPFVRNAFQDSIAQYCSAHNITDISKIPYTAVEKAQQDAFDATFKSTSTLANSINALKRKGGPAAEVLDVLFPFTTTPINIVNQMLEYSPAGFVKAINQGFNKNSVGAVDSFSKAAVGSVAIGLGAFLRSIGLITGGEDDDKGKAAFDKATGNSPYSFGGVISYDWAQPAGSLLALGADIYESVKDDKSVADAMLNALITASDSVLNLSVFSNIVSVLQSGYGSPTEKVLKNVVESFASQMTPGIVGDVAKIVDPTVRSTYTGGSMYQNMLARLESNIPGISKFLPGSVNVKGEDINRGNFGSRMFNTLINPGNVNTGHKTEYDVALEEIYEETGNKNVFMDPSPYSVTIDSKDFTLTGAERSQFQRTMGQAYYGKYLPQAVNSGIFESLSGEQKVKVLQNLQEQAKYDAMAELAANKGEEYDSNLNDVSSLSDIPSYYSYKNVLGSAADRKADVDYSTVDGLLKRYNVLPQDVKDELKDQSGLHLRNLEYANKMGIGSEDWYKTYDAIKDARVKTASQAQAVTAAAVYKTAPGNDEAKLNALRAQIPPDKGDGKTASIIRRYEAAMSQGYSFADWTKFEVTLNDINVGGGTPSNTEIYNAAKAVGIDMNQAKNIYKSYSKDEDYVELYDQTYAALNPAEEREPGMNLTDYLYGSDVTAQQQIPSWLARVQALGLPVYGYAN